MRWGLLSLVLCACPPLETPFDAGAPLVGTDASVPPCLSAYPERIDFGEVDAFNNAFTRLRVTNLSSRSMTLAAPPLDPPFGGAQGFDRADLSPGESTSFNVSFTPADGLLHFGSLDLSEDGGCSLRVPLRGLGKGSFSHSPEVLDFGPVDPGTTRELELQLSNTQRDPVVFDRVFVTPQIDGGNPFTLSFSTPLIASPTAITTVRVSASPPDFGEYQATLLLNGPNTARSIPMRVVGGVPVAEVSPAVIDVPKMDFSKRSSPPSFIQLSFTLRNVGTGEASAAALRPVPPFSEVTTADGGQTNDVHARVSLGNPLMPGEEDEGFIDVNPPGLGEFHYAVRLFTNDPQNPERLITVNVIAANLPTCSLQAPTRVQFTASPDAGSSGMATFANTGGTSCVLSSVFLAPFTSPGYRIISGRVQQLELSPGQRHEVTMTGPDAGDGTFSVLNFHVQGPNSFVQTIDLEPP